MNLALVREFQRVFGDDAKATEQFVLLPLAGPDDALTFFRTVPCGTPVEQLLPLASAYRAAHPVGLGTRVSEDPEAAI